MKKIEIDDELYHYIASNTQSIGENATQILRRLLNLSPITSSAQDVTSVQVETIQDDLKTDVASEKTNTKNSKKAKKLPSAKSKGDVFNLLNKEELAIQKGVVGRFLFILSALHRTHKDAFDKVLEVKGKHRIYFATSKEALLDCGSSMNPKNIPESDYWVMTNSNTTRKKLMLHEVATILDYSESQAEKLRDYL
ncbi:replication initiation negative regulator SeqA [Pseudoalteromonas denitrificans]|jgi:negative modulator of initiation of replication|uniref:Negative modulator of initiation of replication n=1 Tax=Pseudoalteromonas denitrificans DSM 6059 TaxID=1123010 RepID=A0A1I1MAG9_9GAMM|nr:replication initiation negative regulator SeqA [Pseudoalteromonas denitrificans]SFC79583.1 negative regulator of replication initiation SeqA [Pseudoalteromonas denitrificans DSM 6059]